MSEDKSGLEVIEAGLRLAREYESEQRARYHDPFLALGDLSRVSGAPVSTLRNWVDRKLLALDADTKRVPGKHRRFSFLDAIKVLTAHQLSAQGVLASQAAAAAEVMTDAVERDLVRPGPGLVVRSVICLDLSVEPPCPVRLERVAGSHHTALILVNLPELIDMAADAAGWSFAEVAPASTAREAVDEE